MFNSSKTKLGKPRLFGRGPDLRYDKIAGEVVYPPPMVSDLNSVALLFPNQQKSEPHRLPRIGARLKTGQQLPGTVSPVTGSVTSVGPFFDLAGKPSIRIEIELFSEEEVDPSVKRLRETPSRSVLKALLARAPGRMSIEALLSAKREIDRIIVVCSDEDLKVLTTQHIVRARGDEMNTGIAVLKEVLGIDAVFLATPNYLSDKLTSIGEPIKVISSKYPAASPRLIMKNVFKRTLSADSTLTEQGIYFLSAETVASIGRAYKSGALPVDKTLTVIDKTGSTRIISARIGAKVRDILRFCDIDVHERDRVVIGGPMRGSAAPSLDYPIGYDTDAVFVQSPPDSQTTIDPQCINCGECVRHCPARLPVNMLARVLMCGDYRAAQSEYDIQCCIECGICSYVCISELPLLQYLTWAKHRLAATTLSEASRV